MDKYFFIVKTSLKDALYYRGRIVAATLSWSVRIITLFLLYKFTFDYVGRDVNGVTFETAIWSMSIYFIILSFGARKLYSRINQDVTSGNIEVLLNKPFDYLQFKISELFGRGLPDGIVAFIVLLALLIGLSGVPTFAFSIAQAISLLIFSVFGILMAYYMYSLVGITSIWIENSDPVYWFVDKFILILGGSYMPVALFPGFLKTASEYSPFGATMFATQILRPDVNDLLPRLIIIQTFWLVFFVVMAKTTFYFATKKLSVNGG